MVKQTLPRSSVVRVIGITELTAMTAAFDSSAVVVVDGTDHSALPVTLLAQLVRMRRVLRVAGGELVLAAGEPVAQLLRQTGLLFAIPYFTTVSDALGSLDAATEDDPRAAADELDTARQRRTAAAGSASLSSTA
jgi:anti-anti-sigma regulatory factor